jgi:class 3 adenylate cyclase
LFDVEALTLDTVCTRFPWSAEALALGRPVERIWYYDVNVPAAALWSLLVDTSRMNRALGLPEMHFEERDGRLHGRAVYGGLRHEWVEEPWDWVAQRHLFSVRSYSRGYAHQSRALYHVRARPHGGVQLTLYFGWVPRGPVSRWCIRTGLRRLRARLDRLIPELASALAPAALQAAPAPLAGHAQERLEAARDELLARRLPAEAVEDLLDLVRHGEDADLERMQVRALALARGVPEHDLLRVCLHATRLGLLTMSWDVICPHCRGVVEEARTLGDLPRLGACAVCAIDFATDKLNAVEITFHVHPSIRAVRRRLYCSAELVTKQHVAVQQRLAAGASATVSSQLAPGRYRMRLHGSKSYRFLDVRGERASSQPITDPRDYDSVPSRFYAWHAAGAGDAATLGQPTLQLVNDTAEPQIFVVERVDWSDAALRPAQLFSLQEFRDLFSEQYLGANVQLAVGEQAILFTDIVGSTRLYARSGDPDAFMAVKKHFELIFGIVGQHRGAVVKTIGDAAMAAFERPVDALRAAREIHAYFGPEQRETPIRLRMALNTGPCIAVKLNSNIDYFGSTVNLAAKLQGCAGPGDIAMSPTVVDAAGVLDYLRQQEALVQYVTMRIDALDKDLSVLVWRTFPLRTTQARVAGPQPNQIMAS